MNAARVEVCFLLLILSAVNLVKADTEYEIEEQGCIDNKHGIFTDVCSGQADQELAEVKSNQFEDSFVLSKRQQEFLEARRDDDVTEPAQGRVVINNVESDVFELWPAGKKIPYEIDDSIDDETKTTISEAIADIEKLTCVKFQKREKGKDKFFLTFFKGKGCWSFIGMRKDKENVGQKISIGDGCGKKGEVLHQIMHAFGFLNEHNREDRDIYVEINWENIIPDKKKYFRISKQFVQNFLGSDYDYKSIMHYSRNQYSKNGKDTISIFGCSLKAKKILDVIGQRDGLSAGDRFQINKLFKCPTNNKRQSIIDDTLDERSTISASTDESTYTCS